MACKISVIGTGYVGLVTGTCFAETGNDVLCVDIDEEKVNKLKRGEPTIFEPGLERLLKNNVEAGRLNFTTKIEDALEDKQLIFLCLPTPPKEDGSADLKRVLQVTEQIAKILTNLSYTDPKIIVDKSTVPVGTSDKVKKILSQYLPADKFEVASNPEFLREGFAIDDTLKPDRIVVGTSSEYVKKIMNDLYQPFLRSGNPIYFMDEKSAEVTKYAANAFLATKISFMNDLSAYCEKTGADIEKIRLGIGSDNRIGKKFLFAGIGFGGSCFPKDVRALMYSTEEAGTPLSIVKATYDVNLKQTDRFVDKIKNRFGDLKGVKFALWGLAFKHNTDDVRESPAFRIIERLLDEGAEIKAYDPEAISNAKERFSDRIEYADKMYDALDGADSIIIATEWTVFRNPDFNKLKAGLKKPIVFDGRNLYSPSDMKEKGFEYYCVGRKSISGK